MADTATQAAPATDFKQIYRTYDSAQSDGSYFRPLIAEKDYPTAYPDTETPVPDGLKGKSIFYDWTQPGNGAWVDISTDTQKAQLAGLIAANKDLQQQFSDAAFQQMTADDTLTQAQNTIKQQGDALAAQAKSIDSLNSTLSDATYQLMMLTTPDDKTATDTQGK